MFRLLENFKPKNLLTFMFLIALGASASAEKETPLHEVFEAFNECVSVKCSVGYLDGVMLRQVQSLNTEDAERVLRHLKLSSYESRSKIIGDYGALFISDYKGPETHGGTTLVWLFNKINGSWKIYHRLPEEKVGTDLKPNIQ